MAPGALGKQHAHTYPKKQTGEGPLLTIVSSALSFACACARAHVPSSLYFCLSTHAFVLEYGYSSVRASLFRLFPVIWCLSVLWCINICGFWRWQCGLEFSTLLRWLRANFPWTDLLPWRLFHESEEYKQSQFTLNLLAFHIRLLCLHHAHTHFELPHELCY